MSKYTFTLSEVKGEHGHAFPLLTANEYPWMNIQIVPTSEGQRDMIMEALRRRGGSVAQVAGRNDFVAIQAGGGTDEHPTVEITAQNYRQVAAIINDSLQAGADFWAEYSAKKKQ